MSRQHQSLAHGSHVWHTSTRLQWERNTEKMPELTILSIRQTVRIRAVIGHAYGQEFRSSLAWYK